MQDQQAASATAYQFGEFRLDTRRQQLSRRGEPLSLEPKAFEVLRLLIQHRDRLVTKEELLDTVWRGTFVAPNVLTRAIAQIRKTLGDDARESRFIETAATRGYRFIHPVDAESAGSSLPGPVAPPPPSSPPPPAHPRSAAVMWTALAVAAIVVIVAAGWLWASRSRDPDTATLQPRRLTSKNGYHGMAALSPDGRLIAYASERDTGLELIVSGVDLGNDEIVLTSDGGQNMQPEWSPDGRWIAFHSRARGGIWIVPSTGGTARQLVDFGSDPAWSPSGEQIVFASDAGGMAAQSVLWIVGRDGQDPRPLTSRGNPLGGHHDPAFEPSGQGIIFVVRRGTWSDEIWRMQLHGGELTKLVEGLVISAPRVSPDGRTLLWGGMGARGLGGLWQGSLGDDRDVQPRQLLTLNTGLVRAVSIAASGEVVYSVTDSDSNLWSIGTQPGAEPVKITDDNGRVTYPDYSPDGRLAFAQLVVGNPVTAWISDENGKGRQRILPDLAASFPQWTADGSKLLVRRGAPGDPDYLWVDTATRKTTPVPVDFRDAQSVKVSPDGAYAAYHVIQPDGTMNVFKRPLAGGPAVQLTQDREAISYPGWSRDGRRLALEIKRGNETHIGVMPADGGPVEQLTSDHGQSWPHSWAPDNDRIAFAGQRDGVWNVWTVSARTRQQQRLTSFTSGAGYVRYPSWSPRGDRIVFERSVETASVWAVQLPDTAHHR